MHTDASSQMWHETSNMLPERSTNRLHEKDFDPLDVRLIEG